MKDHVHFLGEIKGDSRTTKIHFKLDVKHLLVKGVQVCSNDGPMHMRERERKEGQYKGGEWGGGGRGFISKSIFALHALKSYLSKNILL